VNVGESSLTESDTPSKSLRHQVRVDNYNTIRTVDKYVGHMAYTIICGAEHIP
jgi:hypothetical protein